MPTKCIAVISDTHFPSRGTQLPQTCANEIRKADLVIHAGDHADMGAVVSLRALGTPVVAVHGNVDAAAVRDELPADTIVEEAGLRIAVIHDAGPHEGRLERMRRRFPDVDGVVFGHSHIPLIERADDGFFILNPGSATDRRRQPHHTMAMIVVEPGRAAEIDIIPLDAE